MGVTRFTETARVSQPFTPGMGKHDPLSSLIQPAKRIQIV